MKCLRVVVLFENIVDDVTMAAAGCIPVRLFERWHAVLFAAAEINPRGCSLVYKP